MIASNLKICFRLILIQLSVQTITIGTLNVLKNSLKMSMHRW